MDAIGRQFKHTFQYQYVLMGAVAIDKTGSPLPDETVATCLKSDAILFGAIGHPKYDNDPSAKIRPEQGLMKIRKELNLFANIRPVTTYSALHHLSPLKNSRLADVDFVIFRELIGGIYFGKKELSADKNLASDDCVYHRSEIERVAHLAFKYAQKRRKVLTLVDKANVLETSRLWRKVVQEIAPLYPSVVVNYMYAGIAAMQLITNPKQFDVILTENMMGDIFSDEASVLTGSLGLLPSASVGDKLAMFEPIHGSYPAATGKNIANPMGSILAAGLMLEYFRMYEEAALVKEAIEWNIANGFVTKDIDPINNYSTSTIGELVTDYVENKIPSKMNKENMVISKSTII